MLIIKKLQILAAKLCEEFERLELMNSNLKVEISNFIQKTRRAEDINGDLNSISFILIVVVFLQNE